MKPFILLNSNFEFKTVYALIAYSGEFDDYREHVIYAVSTEEEANAARAHEEKYREESRTRSHLLLDVAWAAEQKALEVSFPNIVEVPEPPKSPVKSTKESLAELKQKRDEWELIARPIIDQNDAERTRVHRIIREAVRIALVNLGATTEEIDLLGYGEGCHLSCRIDRETFDYGLKIEPIKLFSPGNIGQHICQV